MDSWTPKPLTAKTHAKLLLLSDAYGVGMDQMILNCISLVHAWDNAMSRWNEDNLATLWNDQLSQGKNE